MFDKYLLVMITTMLPVSELRGGIPVGIALGLEPISVFIFAVVTNALIFFPIFFGLKIFYNRFFLLLPFARKIVERTRKKGKPYIDKYGVWGLIIFVGVPLPITGAWTGILLAWLFGLDWKRSFIAVCIGVLISGTIVMLISLGLLNGLKMLM